MRIKRFCGENPLEVLAEVKRVLGEEALILSSRKREEAGRVLYEIMAAVDREEVPERGNGKAGKSPEILAELAEIKRLLQEALSEKLLRGRYLRLLEAGVPAFWASRFSDPLARLRERIRAHQPGPASRVQILVGLPGVGKTSSAFKLAAWWRYRKGRPVAVLALDRYRIGAKAEARRLGELLDLPVLAEGDLPPEGALLVVDTPAWGPNFREEELADLVGRFPEARIYPVLRTTESPEVLVAFLKGLRDFPLAGSILTYTDRLPFGPALGFLLEPESPPPAFVSGGPRVPEDWEEGTRSVLERVFLRGLNRIFTIE
ncbi:hypothetical protein FVE67_01355 [Thermosulfurimonas marina]|uniref:SRP54-type proteins GTP-binding domain-containing protein n=1 Tax=Thermosulfurimonas marina TaxID=2047767 RepID=A0A6H1WQQ0_9BACT|nr:hypothetical protein [Thermosulfurimonas marina]QJA05522.1 hypothetical protein FVE67_01355 [Thermosulfurimonas marina]